MRFAAWRKDIPGLRKFATFPRYLDDVAILRPFATLHTNTSVGKDSVNERHAAFTIVWPVDCPPGDSIDGSGWFYRVTMNNPPAHEDFLTHHETGKRRNMHPCERCALSVCQTKEDAVQTLVLFPKLGKYIARGHLADGCGKVKMIGGSVPTHTNWWPLEEVESRCSRFAVEG